LREELLRDRRAVNVGEAGAPKLGKIYYDKMRDRFSSANAPCKKLKASDETQPLHPELEKGLMGLMLRIKRYAAILDFLERGPMVNQLSLVVLLKHALKVSPKSGKDGLQFLMALLGWCSRHGVPHLHPEEWQHIREHMDEALHRSWLSSKTSGLSPSVWWEGTRSGAKLVLEENIVDELISMKVGEEWFQVEAKLATIVQDSIVGKALFGAAFSKLLRGKVSAVIAEQVDEIGKATRIGKGILEGNRKAFLDKMAAMGRDPMEARPPRGVEARYRGSLIVSRVTSAHDEYCLKVDAAVRGAAVENKVLPGLLCEDSLVSKVVGSGATPDVDAAVVEANKKARAAAEELMKGKVHSGAIIQATFYEKRSLLLQLDRSFRLELDLFASVSGEGAERRLLDEVVAILPKEGHSNTQNEVLALLALLQQSKLLEFAGVGLQATFRSVVGIVEAIDSNKAPAFDGSNLSPFMKSVMEEVARFCSYADTEGGEKKVIFGKQAAEMYYKKLQARASAKEAITLQDLALLVPFQWLVGSGIADDIKAWSAQAAKADLLAGAAAAVASSSSSSSKSMGSRATGRKKTTSDARSLVLACLKD